MSATRTRTELGRRVLRTEAATARLTTAEVKVVEAAAAVMGMTRSSAMRTLLLAGAHAQLERTREQ